LREDHELDETTVSMQSLWVVDSIDYALANNINSELDDV
jgi:hypothetical protein